jgi:hypothetical protein
MELSMWPDLVGPWPARGSGRYGTRREECPWGPPRAIRPDLLGSRWRRWHRRCRAWRCFLWRSLRWGRSIRRWGRLGPLENC